MKISKEYLSSSPLSTEAQRELEKQRVQYFSDGIGSISEKLNSVMRFMSRQNVAKYMCYYEVFKMTRDVVGSIIECGVYFGNGLMTYANLAAALEPYNYQCRIIGFDTFSGDLGVSAKDTKNPYFRREEGDYYADSYEDLKKAIAIYDRDRPLSHLNKVELVKGDLRESAREYINRNPALAIRILHLGVNLYEPTKMGLKAFWPRMTRGGIVAVHGINYSAEGACQAILEEVGQINKIRFRTFDFYPNFCYFIVE